MIPNEGEEKREWGNTQKIPGGGKTKKFQGNPSIKTKSSTLEGPEERGQTEGYGQIHTFP